MGAGTQLADLVASMPLVDHHVHATSASQLSAAEFDRLLTEGGAASPPGTSMFDSQLGVALLRWCAPVLGLDPSPEAATYLERRHELGPEEVDRRMLAAAGCSHLLLDTGFTPAGGRDLRGMAGVTSAACLPIVRLETLAEGLARAQTPPEAYPDGFRAALAERLRDGAVGTKTVLAYRCGFDVDLSRPSDAEVRASFGAWLRAAGPTPRLVDPRLVAFGIWEALDTGVPLQVHTGFGDSDLDLSRCDPLLLTGFLRASAPAGTPVVLLHCYPFHRGAGYLAQTFDHVYFDIGLAVLHTGAQSRRIVAESLELGPFAKQLFSSDAYGPSELHLLGALLWRRGFAAVVGAWVDSGEWSLAQGRRCAELIGAANARRIYRL